MTENNIKYALEDVERNRKDTMKMCEAVKKSNDWHPKKNRLLKHDKDLPQMKKKAARNHSKILFTSSEIRKAV